MWLPSPHFTVPYKTQRGLTGCHRTRLRRTPRNTSRTARNSTESHGILRDTSPTKRGGTLHSTLYTTKPDTALHRQVLTRLPRQAWSARDKTLHERNLTCCHDIAPVHTNRTQRDTSRTLRNVTSLVLASHNQILHGRNWTRPCTILPHVTNTSPTERYET